MKLFDFECISCGKVEEHLVHESEPSPICLHCGGGTKKIISSSRRINAFKPGFFDIDVDPVYCETKQDLKRELDARQLRSPYTHC